MTPRFSDRERDLIRARLLDAGHRHFAAAGLKKTSVAEVAEDAGIAKGSFYSFFGSKEELFLAVTGRYARQKSELVAAAASAASAAGAQGLRAFIDNAAKAFADGSAYAVFKAEDGEIAMRKLSMEVAMRYVNDDEHWLAPAVRVWQEQGLAAGLDTGVVAELLGMVVLVPLTPGIQRGERFDRALQLMIDAVVCLLSERGPDGAGPTPAST